MKYKVLREETVCPFLSFSIEKAVLWGARKNHRSFSGTAGVLTYYVPCIKQTLAVMWSVVPHSGWYKNSWNVKLYSREEKATSSKWYDLYYNAKPFEGDYHWYDRDLGALGKFRGSMTGSEEAILEIHISRK